MGLMEEYCKPNSACQEGIYKILALPYLPHNYIVEEFTNIRSNSDNRLSDICNYIDRTWIRSQFWTPESWSVYNRGIRKNNDCEGLRYIWNSHYCKTKLTFYNLVGQMFEIGNTVALEVKLISHDKLVRYQRLSIREKDILLRDTWNRLEGRELSPAQALDIFVDITRKKGFSLTTLLMMIG